MPTAAEFFPSNYSRVADLHGNELVVTIDYVDTSEFENDGKKQTKPVVHFKDTGVKPLVTNKTNFLLIATICGENSNGWHGKRICLYPALVPFKGKVEPAIRVKAPPPDSATPQSAPVPAAPAPRREVVIESRANYDVSTTKSVLAVMPTPSSAPEELNEVIPF
jgi:hypothetical protein